MIDFKNLINKQAKSYEVACKCAKTENIYAEGVLWANKYNMSFLYDLRQLELDVCEILLLQSIFRAESIEPCTINIVTTNRADVIKVMANANLDSALEALECDYYTKKAFKRADGSFKYSYEVKFNLTL